MSDADPRQLLQQLPAELESFYLIRAPSRPTRSRVCIALHTEVRRLSFANIESISTATTFGDSIGESMPNQTAFTSNSSKMRQP